MSRERAADKLSRLTNTSGELVTVSGHATARRHAVLYGVLYVMDGETRILFYPDGAVSKAREAVYVLNGAAHYVASYHDDEGFVIVAPIDSNAGEYFDPAPRAYVWSVDLLPSVPVSFPVRPIPAGSTPGAMTCGTCGRSWDDTVSTEWTPVPGGRCPFEYFH